MSEQEYFEQFAGDDEPEPKAADPIPAFSPDCPDCHGAGFVLKGDGFITLEMPCYRCFDLAGR